MIPNFFMYGLCLGGLLFNSVQASFQTVLAQQQAPRNLISASVQTNSASPATSAPAPVQSFPVIPSLIPTSTTSVQPLAGVDKIATAIPPIRSDSSVPNFEVSSNLPKLATTNDAKTSMGDAVKKNIVKDIQATHADDSALDDDELTKPVQSLAKIKKHEHAHALDSDAVSSNNKKEKVFHSAKHVAKEAKHVDAQKQAEKLDQELQQKVQKLVQYQEKEPNVLYQDAVVAQEDFAGMVFNFKDASLSNLLSYMELQLQIKFISDDVITAAKAATGIAGHKITFQTNKNISRKDSWDLCITFLNIAGFNVVPTAQEGFYRLVSLTKTNNEPIPAYIGVDSDVLPDNDMIVRYVYFSRNVDPAKIQPILSKMQGGSAKLDVYSDLKGLIFTDRAASIKSLMQIVKELDRASLPEVLSVVKLKRANADDVIALYNSLRSSSSAAADGSSTQPQRAWVAAKRESTVEYFPQNVVLVSDKRTNSLILLGTAKDVARVEEFVTKHIDVPAERSAPPIFTYRLQYTNANDIATLLQNVVTYGGSTTAGQYGGVRDGSRYLQSMTIVPDPFSNSLVINARPEDYAMVKPLIDELDVPQRQIGLEILMVQVKDVDVKLLGSQISGPNGQGSPNPGASLFGPTFLQSVTAQTSGMPQGSQLQVTNATNSPNNTDFSLKSSLAALLGNPLVNEVGSVLVTFGQPIWAIFKVLKSITSTHIIANPFLVVANNSQATLQSGEQRRQISGSIVSSSAVKATGFVPIDATLNVTITPSINKDNMITLYIDVTNQQFTDTAGSGITSEAGSPRDKKEVTTYASVANGETLVLGGIMVENYASSSTGVPFLEHIPLLGWLFKSKSRKVSRDHFLVFICPRVLEAAPEKSNVDAYTKYKLGEANHHISLIDESDWFASSKDPIQKAFFGSTSSKALQEMQIGKNFERRESVDGKIDSAVVKAPRKSKRYKPRHKKKQAAAQQVPQLKPALEPEILSSVVSEPMLVTKNSISNSVQSTSGDQHVV